ncbi:MAG TPA: DUF1801 domain-containing protein [Caulobacteraceae bacterium]|jgi:hypothetical protein|nr:DUF1801 domain-containing protein [Caulobacteraceae bacterium]
MAKANKTAPSAASVDDFLGRVSPEGRRADALAVRDLMAHASGETARLWGPAIVGFGVHRYRYDSGSEGETPAVGFSPRKQALVLYGLGAAGGDLTSLGKVTGGVGCIYVKRLADVDQKVLGEMIARAFAERASA